MSDDAPSTNCAEAWRAFGSDTEAGRLLKKLYCGQTKPKIAYPKPKVKHHENSAPFIPGGGSLGSEARTHQLAVRVSDRSIRAPTVAKHERPEIHPIDYMVARRKPYSQIEREVNEIKRQMEAYRSTCIKRKPNQEKEKLQQVFSYTAGTILPRELLPSSDLLGRELAHSNTLRTGKTAKSRLDQLEEIYDSVLQEIETRKAFVSEIISLGRPEKAESVEKEILERFSELRRIHQLMEKARVDHDNNENK